MSTWVWTFASGVVAGVLCIYVGRLKECLRRIQMEKQDYAQVEKINRGWKRVSVGRVRKCVRTGSGKK